MTTTLRASLALAGFTAMAAGLTITAPVEAVSASVPTTHVAITNFSFSPAKSAAALGGLVTWTNRDMVAHTSTSDQGFWGSPSIAPGASWSRRFTSAGTFAYHCAIHPDMHGSVSVRPHVSPLSHGGVVTWAVGSGRFDVQIEKPGTTRWVAYRTGTTTRSATFRATRVGRYLFRARTRSGSAASGWSPAAAVAVR